MRETIEAHRSTLPEEVQEWLKTVEKASINMLFFSHALFTELTTWGDKEAASKIQAINQETYKAIQSAGLMLPLHWNKIVKDWQNQVSIAVSGYSTQELAPPLKIAA